MTLDVDIRTAGYGHGPILRDIRLVTDDTGFHLVTGRNGMGKTTLLRTVMGMMLQVDADITINGHNPYVTELGHLAQSGVTLMPQEGGVFDALTVDENLQLTASRESAEKVLKILPGWESRMRQPAGTLSGGERKVLGLARAVGQQPKVLLVDEPTEGVWHEHLGAISGLLAELADQALVVVVEQNLTNFLQNADRVIVLERGGIALEGAPAEVASDPALEKLLSL